MVNEYIKNIIPKYRYLHARSFMCLAMLPAFVWLPFSGQVYCSMVKVVN